jgi:stage V sporulation protein G
MNPMKSDSTGKTAAFFDVQTDDGITLKGFRLVNGSNGLFLSTPDQKGKDGKYYETVILPKEMKIELEKIAIEEFSKIPK